MLVILDSNVMAAAAEGIDESMPFLVVEGILARGHRLLLSPALQSEYQRVLMKPELSRRHLLSAEEQNIYLTGLGALAVTDLPPRYALDCPDRRDQALWDLLGGNEGSILVTGEHALLRSRHFPGRILSPRQFVERYLDG